MLAGFRGNMISRKDLKKIITEKYGNHIEMDGKEVFKGLVLHDPIMADEFDEFMTEWVKRDPESQVSIEEIQHHFNKWKMLSGFSGKKVSKKLLKDKIRGYYGNPMKMNGKEVFKGLVLHDPNMEENEPIEGEIVDDI